MDYLLLGVSLFLLIEGIQGVWDSFDPKKKKRW